MDTRSRSPRQSKALQNIGQLCPFPLAVELRRIRPELNEWRYYRLSVQPDLFGGAALVRNWGRIGTAGSQRIDLHSDEATAMNALTAMIHYRLKRGYAMSGP